MVRASPSDAKLCWLPALSSLFTGIEIKVRQNDNVTTIIRAFLIASPTHNEGDLDPSEYFPDVPQDEHYHRSSWQQLAIKNEKM